MRKVIGREWGNSDDPGCDPVVEEPSGSMISSSRRLFLRSQIWAAGIAMGRSLVPGKLDPFALALDTLGASRVSCHGAYPQHLQGICTNNLDAIYWSFTVALVKTDVRGNVLKQIRVPFHHGDLCFKDDRIYVAVNLNLFNDVERRADSWVYVYSADDLEFVAKRPVKEVVYGAGGMTCNENSFIVVGGLPRDFQENYIFEYSPELTFIRKIALKTGYTSAGIQTAAYNNGCYWFGCYGTPPVTLKVDSQFRSIETFAFDSSDGIVPVSPRTFWIGRGKGPGERAGFCGELLLADINQAGRLSIRS